jgi:cell division transport system permease protein
VVKLDEKRRGAVRTEPAAKPAPAAGVSPKGAQRHKVGFADHRRSWFRNHIDVAGEAYHRLWSTPLATLMTLAVLAIALALPGTLLAGLKNLQLLSLDMGTEPRISLYLHTQVSDADADALSRRLLQRDDLAAVEMISREQGLREFRQASGMDDVLKYLSGNPLPTVIVVLPRDLSKASLPLLQEKLKALPEVEDAVLDLEWIQRLAALVELARQAVLVFGVLLALAVLLVVGNTIRLAIESRRDEIVVAKLVGATNAWVRRPFLYTGLWFGMLGGIFAWVLVQVSLLLLQQPVEQLVDLYQSSFRIVGLGLLGSAGLICASMLLGWLGAWLAVGRHLREIEPR